MFRGAAPSTFVPDPSSELHRQVRLHPAGRWRAICSPDLVPDDLVLICADLQSICTILTAALRTDSDCA